MLNLKKWRKRCEQAEKREKFTTKDYQDSRNPCKCAIGECAEILKSTYDDVFISVEGNDYHDLNKAEMEFMQAITDNKPKNALTAIRKIERIVNRITKEFN